MHISCFSFSWDAGGALLVGALALKLLKGGDGDESEKVSSLPMSCEGPP